MVIIDSAVKLSISVDEINKEIGDDLSPDNLWTDPQNLMYEKIHDIDYLDKDQFNLFREGIVGDLFNEKILKVILKHLPKPITDVYAKEGCFKMRYFLFPQIFEYFITDFL